MTELCRCDHMQEWHPRGGKCERKNGRKVCPCEKFSPSIIVKVSRGLQHITSRRERLPLGYVRGAGSQYMEPIGEEML